MNFTKSGGVNRILMSIDVDDTSRDIGVNNIVESVEENVCPYCGQHADKLLSNPVIEKAAQLGIIPILGPGPGQGMSAGPGGECVCPQCGHKASHTAGQPCAEDECPKCGAIMVRDLQDVAPAETMPEVVEDNLIPESSGENTITVEEPGPNIEVLEGDEPGVTLVIKICENCLNRAIELAGGDKLAKFAEVTDNLLYCQTCGYSQVYDGGDVSRKCPVCDMPNALNLLPQSEEVENL